MRLERTFRLPNGLNLMSVTSLNVIRTNLILTLELDLTSTSNLEV